MAVVACLWCETSLKPGTVICRECGLVSPAGDAKAAKRGSREAAHRGWLIALVLVAAPLMLSAAYAAGGGDLTLVSAEIGRPAVAPMANPTHPPAMYSDPLQRSVWIDGVRAVQQVLAQPGYSRFAGSYVEVAAGHVVSFCGEVAGTSGYDGANGARRFISVFGQTQSTMLEGNDTSFEVLWTRVCGQDESPA
jgi:hypothetical protein